MRHYDVIVIGAGPGGIFATYELAKKQPELSIACLLYTSDAADD